MKAPQAAIQARVSSREQDEEGYSRDAQMKSLRTYAVAKGFDVVKEWSFVESAKSSGRKHFDEMVAFFKRNRSCRILLAEKTDRLYRNHRDALTLEELEIEIHSKDSKSQ